VVWNQRLKMLRENTLRTVSRFRISLTETQEKVWQCGGGQEIDQSELGAIVGQTVKAKEYFNNNPRRSMTGGYDDVYKQVIRLLPTGKKHLKVLDVGCGIGNFVYRLEEQNYTNVTGVDFAETSLGIAKKRTPNYNLFLHDLTKPLPFKDDSFDVAVCLDVIQHTKNPFEILEEVIMVSRQSIITIPNGVWAEIRTIFKPQLISKSTPDFVYPTENCLRNAIHYLLGNVDKWQYHYGRFGFIRRICPRLLSSRFIVSLLKTG